MSKNTVYYNELQPDQLINRINDCPIAFLPLGTLEWHSFHLPLGTDSLIPKYIFEQIATKIGGVVLPELFLAPDCNTQKNDKTFTGMEMCSFEDNHPQQLLGNAYFLPEEEFSIIVKRILANLKRNGFQIVVGHGHGPSMNYFRKNQTSFFNDFGLKTFTLFDLAISDKEELGVQTDHAAANETSLIMSIDSNLVDLQKLASAQFPIAIWGKNPISNASKEFGDKIIDTNITKASNTLKEILKEIDFKPLDKELKFTNVKNLCD